MNIAPVNQTDAPVDPSTALPNELVSTQTAKKVQFAIGTKSSSTFTRPFSIQEEVEIRSKRRNDSRKRKPDEVHSNDETETTTSGTQVASATEVLKKMKKPVSDVEVTKKTSEQSSSAAHVDQRKTSNALVPVEEVSKRTGKSPSKVVTVDVVSKKKKEKKSVAEKVIKSVKASNELTAVNYQGHEKPFETLCKPFKLAELIKGFTKKQKSDVIETGFGGFLHMKLDAHLPLR